MGVKKKAILVVAVLIVFLSSFHLFSGIRQYDAEMERLVLLQRHQFDHGVISIKEKLLDYYGVRLRSFVEVRDDIVAAFAARDRDALFALALPVYQAMKRENPHLFVMHFHTPDGRSYLRMHRKDFWGDDLREIRPDVQHVHETKKQMSCFEVGRYGVFYRVIQPVFAGARYLGAVEVGIEARQLVEEVIKGGHLDAALVLRGDRWRKATLNEESQRVFGKYVLVHDGEAIFKALPRQFDPAGTEARATVAGRHYIVHRSHLLEDYEKKNLGGLIAFQDISDLEHGKRNFVLKSLLLSAFLLVVSLLYLFLVFGRLLGTLDSYRSRQEELIAELSGEIAERKGVEEALRASEAKLSAMLESLGDHILMVNQDYEIVWANDAAWGRGRETITGRPCFEVVGCMEHQRGEGFQCPARRTFMDGQHNEAEIQIRADDGLLKVYHCSANVALRGEDGTPAAVMEIFRDITARRTAESALASLHHRYGLLLAAAGDGIYDVDLDGNTTYANPAVERLTGFAIAEIVGRHQHDIFHHSRKSGAHYPREECPILRAMATGEVRRVNDEVFWRKDGSSFPVEYVATPVREKGKIVGAVVVFKDVSERKNLEMQLLQSQKMEAVGRLAGGIAHDFNNHLGVILGYGNILQEKLGAEDPNRRYLDAMVAAASSASGLTGQLLAFSRKQVLEMRMVRLEEVVETVVLIMERVLEKSITLKVHRAERECRVMGDPVQLEQVLMNLVVNAKDAMPEGGTLLIETGCVDLDDAFVKEQAEVKPGRYAMLLVGDTGMGIPPEARQRMFEPFFTTKELGKGTGLGLATVHGIVKQHNGHIFVFSEPGKGTTFKVFFPLLAGKEEKEAPPPGGALPVGRETLLVVDDDAPMRDLLKEFLEETGYRVLLAESGEAAKKVAGREDFSLLLTDLLMPGTNGWELAQSLREAKPGLPVILMSGSSDKILLDADLGKQDVSFLHKPVSQRLLAMKVRESLAARRPV
ncbi:PAS domain S-box protein [Thiovibrio sp. JS02]